MAKLERAIIHVGMEKAGSTSIQEFLLQNRTELLTNGVLVPNFGANGHTVLCALAQDEQPDFPTVRLLCGLRTAEEIEHLRSHIIQALSADVESASDTADTIIISCELFHSNLTRLSEIARLHEIVSSFADRVNILIYFRRQDLVAHSLFSTRIKGGEAWRYPVFQDFSKGIPYYYDYFLIAERYAAIFGRENCCVRRFDPSHFFSGDLISDFMMAAGLTWTDKYVRVPPRNESLKQAALYLLSELNQYIPPFIDGRWNPLRGGLVELLEKGFSGWTPLANREEALVFYSQFAEINEKLKSAFFSETLGPLFSNDFSRYPEKVPPIALQIADVSPIFAWLWNQRNRSF